MADEAEQVIEGELAVLGPPDARAFEVLPLPELLTGVNREALLGSLEVVRYCRANIEDAKCRSQIAQIAGEMTRANLRLAEGEFKARAQSEDALQKVLDAIKRAKAEG